MGMHHTVPSPVPVMRSWRDAQGMILDLGGPRARKAFRAIGDPIENRQPHLLVRRRIAIRRAATSS
jgi:hypothetical protein